MKLVYKCDFCDYTGTAEDVEAHEKVCKYNPAIKHCYTCAHCIIRPGCFTELTVCDLDSVGVVFDSFDCAAYVQGQPRKIIAV